MSGTRLLLLGLDGADPDFLEAHLDRMPALRRLISDGVWARLRSTIPPVTAPAWTVLMSGMNPGKTGVTDFVKVDFVRDGHSLTTDDSVRVPRLWEVLSSQGRRVGVVAVPVTYPVKSVNGVLVSDFMTPPDAVDFTYPPGLRDELEPGYRTSLPSHDFADAGKDRLMAEILYYGEKKVRSVERLLLSGDWDFFTFVISETDWVQHYLRRPPGHPQEREFGEEVLRLFEYVDGAIARLLEAAGPSANVVIVSDHGFGKVVSREVYVNTWLWQQGFLVPRVSASQRVRSYLRPRLRAALGLPGVRRLDLKDRLPGSVKRAALRATALSSHDIDWRRTRAYFSHFGNQTGYVRMNPAAFQDQDEREKTRRAILDELRALRDPESGQLVVTEAYLKEEFYSGPYLDDIPDIVFIFSEEYGGQEQLGSQWLYRIPAGANPHLMHRQDGTFLARGPAFQQGVRLDTVALADVAPTVYHLLGAAVPEGTDGHVLRVAFREGQAALDRPEEYMRFEREGLRGRALSREEEEEVEARLRDLGYL